MNVSDIKEKIQPAVASRGCFIVDVSLSADNDIELVIEKEEGTVEMDDCIAIDKEFHAIWDQDEEDYALTVSSAGLDRPFKVLKQFSKAIGTQVEAKLKGGRKLIGTLEAADENGFTLSYKAKVAEPGSKKKVENTITEAIPMTDANSVVPYITFE